MRRFRVCKESASEPVLNEDRHRNRRFFRHFWASTAQFGVLRFIGALRLLELREKCRFFSFQYYEHFNPAAGLKSIGPPKETEKWYFPGLCVDF